LCRYHSVGLEQIDELRLTRDGMLLEQLRDAVLPRLLRDATC
jgi:hypothetical protein